MFSRWNNGSDDLFLFKSASQFVIGRVLSLNSFGYSTRFRFDRGLYKFIVNLSKLNPPFGSNWQVFFWAIDSSNGLIPAGIWLAGLYTSICLKRKIRRILVKEMRLWNHACPCPYMYACPIKAPVINLINSRFCWDPHSVHWSIL